MSTYILTSALKRIGAEADFYIPDRLRDGYGINEEMITAAANDGIDTIITCDNGISAVGAAEEAKRLGITLIVTDHHELPEVLPDAAVIVDPKHPEDTYPCQDICGAVVAAKLAAELLERRNLEPERKGVLPYLEFMAIATICDVVPLDGENRTIASLGLKKINSLYLNDQNANLEPSNNNGRILTGINTGLKALIDTCELKDRITDYNIGFVIGPCLNATGRLDLAKRALELLNISDMEQALKLAAECRELNEARKDMTFKETEKAFQALEKTKSGSRIGDLAPGTIGKTDIKDSRSDSSGNAETGNVPEENTDGMDEIDVGSIDDRVLVVVIPDCHESLAGIIAGRIRERYDRPTFVITKGKDCMKGSGRSIPEYNMFEEMQKCADLFTKFGGHPMAAGLSLPSENVAEFRRRMNENCTLSEEDMKRKVQLDAAVAISYFDEKSVEELSLFYPCGTGNPSPIFGDSKVKVHRIKRIGKNNNFLRFRMEDSKKFRFDAVCFRDAEEVIEGLVEKYGEEKVNAAFEGKPSDIELKVSYVPEINEYNGTRSIQMKIQGILL